MNADSDIRRAVDPDAYWRRRALMLGGGLFVIILIAWQFSGNPSPSASRTTASKASMVAQQSVAGLPSAAYGKAWPGPSPHRAVTALAKPSRPAAGARCPASDVVLSLFTSQPSYGPAAQPRFDVYAVSTARGWCQMTFGRRVVRVIVTRHGQVVWDSAACASSAAGPTWFERGVPRVLTVIWNRGTTRSARCTGSIGPNARGTFEAIAMAHGQTSAVRSFTLTR